MLDFQALDKLLTPLFSADTCLKLGVLTLNVNAIGETENMNLKASNRENFSNIFQGLGHLSRENQMDFNPEGNPLP